MKHKHDTDSEVNALVQRALSENLEHPERNLYTQALHICVTLRANGIRFVHVPAAKTLVELAKDGKL